MTSATIRTVASSRSSVTRRRPRRSRPASAQAVAIPPMRSLSVGARHRHRATGAASSGWRRLPSSSTIADVPVSAASSEAASTSSPACRPSSPSGTWTTQTSLPAGPHDTSPTLDQRVVSHAPSYSRRLYGTSASSTVAEAPGGMASGAMAPLARTCPPIATSHAPCSQDRSVKCRRFVTVSRSVVASKRDGDRRRQRPVLPQGRLRACGRARPGRPCRSCRRAASSPKSPP